MDLEGAKLGNVLDNTSALKVVDELGELLPLFTRRLAVKAAVGLDDGLKTYLMKWIVDIFKVFEESLSW